MKTILVDDEIWMMEQFEDECALIPEIDMEGKFRNPLDALEFAKKNRIDLAFLDIEMPQMNGLELSKKLREIYPEMIVIFVSAYDKYMADAFRSEKADYFVLKPYTKKDVEAVIGRAKLLSGRLKKRIFVHTFGRFNVFVDNAPLVFLSPKAKELLALLVDRRNDTLSNEEAFYILWEDKPYDNATASAYRKVLRRLRDTLNEAGIGEILVSLPHEHKLNADLFDCDYYQYLDDEPEGVAAFDGEYMSEYSWGEETLAKLLMMQ